MALGEHSPYFGGRGLAYAVAPETRYSGVQAETRDGAKRRGKGHAQRYKRDRSDFLKKDLSLLRPPAVSCRIA